MKKTTKAEDNQVKIAAYAGFWGKICLAMHKKAKAKQLWIENHKGKAIYLNGFEILQLKRVLKEAGVL